MDNRFLFILGSGRRDGNTEILARKTAENLPPTAAQQWLHLMDFPLKPFEDIRHSVGTYPFPESNEKTLFDATLWCTDLVIATPLYWYSVSASTKLYLDYWSAWMRVPEAQFKAQMAGKKMWVISASSSDEDAEKMSSPLVDCLRLSADYMKMEWGGVLLGRGNRAGDVLNDAVAMAAAETFLKLP
jgi:multimeric flavodoxin WrbA